MHRCEPHRLTAHGANDKLVCHLPAPLFVSRHGPCSVQRHNHYLIVFSPEQITRCSRDSEIPKLLLSTAEVICIHGEITHMRTIHIIASLTWSSAYYLEPLYECTSLCSNHDNHVLPRGPVAGYAICLYAILG